MKHKKKPLQQAAKKRPLKPMKLRKEYWLLYDRKNKQILLSIFKDENHARSWTKLYNDFEPRKVIITEAR